jgi:hypothetical protein
MHNANGKLTDRRFVLLNLEKEVNPCGEIGKL